MPRKRTADVAELDSSLEPTAAVPAEEQAVLTRLRNMWEFASLMQYIFLFGHVVKIDEDLDIEDLEAECVKSEPSERLASIGLQLLKYVSSHRGLTPQIFDEYTRRQYVAKAPRRNPFGEDEEPLSFNSLDIYTRIRVLQQLSTWTFGNADRIRGLMPEDEDHLSWRMEPLGWDKEDRAYFVLDDNRLYRRSDERVAPLTPIQKPKAKPKSKAKAKPKPPRSRGTRSSKRRKVDQSEEEEQEEEPEVDENAVDDTVMTNVDETKVAVEEEAEEEGYGFTSKTWELIAITLDDYQEFLSSIFRSRDPNEKLLRARLEEDVLPIIEKRAEAIRQKQLKKLRELENVQKLATAKRSSRLAGKAEKEAQEREEREAEEKKQADLRMAREEQARQLRIEEGHESRRLTREQRVREREAKRILHEEELARLEDDPERATSQGADGDAAADAKRISERQRLTQKEQHKKELEKLEEEDGNWTFDCSVCGVHGENLDDGSHSVACDKCNVWQHSMCNGFTPKQAEKPGFTFVCNTCKRKEEDAKKPKIPPLKLVNHGSGSPESSKSRPVTATGQHSNGLLAHVNRQLDPQSPSTGPRPSSGTFGQIANGPSLSPQGQAQGPPGYRYPPVGNFAPHPAPPQEAWRRSPLPPPERRPSAYTNSSPPIPAGYPPVQHQQQHQHAHQGAVSSAGHPVYHPQQQYATQHYPTNGHAQQPPHGAYAPHQQYHTPQPHPQSQSAQQHLQQPQHGHAHGQHVWSQQQGPPPQSQGAGQLLNGFQSPTKSAPTPVSASPPPQHAQAHAGPQHQSGQLQTSPKTVLPPPANMSQQRAPQSPVKSSPPPHVYQTRPSPHLMQTPQNLPTLSSNGRHHQTHTPQMRPGSRDGPNHTSEVAADGMSGPWPVSSTAIPQKHDQSPAPPSSAHVLGERKIFPPATPLAPSPGQQSGNVIPVKKLQEMSPAALNGPVTTTLQEQPPLRRNQALGPEPPGAPVPAPAKLPSKMQASKD